VNESTVPRVRNLFKQIMTEPERMFELVRMDLKEQCERVVNELLKAGLTAFLERNPYERHVPTEGEKNYRNGRYRRRYATKAIGEIEIQVPRDRNGEFRSQLIAKYERRV
jgi:putative transposase